MGAAFAAGLIVGGLAAPATAAQNAANSVPAVIKCDSGALARSQRAMDAERARLIAKEEAQAAAAGLQVRSLRSLAAESARLTAQAQAAAVGQQVRSQRALDADSARLTAQAQAAGLLQTC